MSLPTHILPSQSAVIDSGSQLVTSQMPKKARVTKQKAPKKTKASRSAVFDAHHTIALILSGNREVIYSLTPAQCKAVINGLADQNHTLESRIGDLESHNEELEQNLTRVTSERDRLLPKPRSMRRDALLAAARSTPTPATESTPAAATTTPAVAMDTSIDFTQPDAESTPLPATSQLQPTVAQQEPATSPQIPQTAPAVPRWRQIIGNTIGRLSPFSRKQTVPQTVPQQQNPSAPLGELPESRKRAAEEEDEEQSDTPTQKRPRTFLNPSVKRGLPHHSSLHTITEYTENSEMPSEVPMSTPSKPPSKPSTKPPQTFEESLRQIQAQSATKAAAKRTFSERDDETESITTSTPATGRKRRTVAEVRAAHAARAAARAGTPIQKSWERTPMVKEPNADLRHARAQEIESTRARLAALEAEAVADGTMHRKLKRVKVDDLVLIPHNRPGDSEGTFRVPDYDSDDEITVDEDAEETSRDVNMFAELEKQTEKVTESTKKRVKYVFPSVGLEEDGYEVDAAWRREQGVKFGRCFDAWVSVGMPA